MRHNDSNALLTTLQLADSFFPTGAYAHSQGLEGMVAQGWVHNAAGVREYLAGLLTDAVLPSDGVALLNSHAATVRGDLATVTEIDRRLQAMKLPPEMRQASAQGGRRLLEETANLVGGESGRSTAASVHRNYLAAVRQGQAPGCGAVAFGVAAAALGMAPDAALLAWCHSLAVGVLGAAQRLLPLTHTEAQQILSELHPYITGNIDEIRERHWADMTSFAPLGDVASILHERAEVRMFAS